MARLLEHFQSVRIFEIHPEESETLEHCVAEAGELVKRATADGYPTATIDLFKADDDVAYVEVRLFSKVCCS
jgi:hypothetical protein